MAVSLHVLEAPSILDFTDLDRWFNKEIVPLYSETVPAEVVFRKVAEEMGEWLQDPSVDEALDTIATLWLWIRLTQYDVKDINAVFEQKVFKLFARQWEKLPDGRWHHKKVVNGGA